jgi:hypothetical protein
MLKTFSQMKAVLLLLTLLSCLSAGNDKYAGLDNVPFEIKLLIRQNLNTSDAFKLFFLNSRTQREPFFDHRDFYPLLMNEIRMDRVPSSYLSQRLLAMPKLFHQIQKYGNLETLSGAAVSLSDPYLVRLLLEKHIFAYSPESAVKKAASLGKFETFKLLRNHLSHFESDDDALIEAIKNNHKLIIEFLVKEGNITLSKGKSVYITSAITHSYELYRFLVDLDRRFSPEFFLKDCISTAITYSKSTVLQELLEYPAVKYINKQTIERFYVNSAIFPDLNVFKTLFYYKMRHFHNEALAKASEYCNTDIVRFIYDNVPKNYINPAASNHKMVLLAVKGKCHDIFRIFLNDDRVDPFFNDYRILRSLDADRAMWDLVLNDHRLNFLRALDVVCKRNLEVIEIFFNHPRVQSLLEVEDIGEEVWRFVIEGKCQQIFQTFSPSMSL